MCRLLAMISVSSRLHLKESSLLAMYSCREEATAGINRYEHYQGARIGDHGVGQLLFPISSAHVQYTGVPYMKQSVL